MTRTGNIPFIGPLLNKARIAVRIAPLVAAAFPSDPLPASRVAPFSVGACADLSDPTDEALYRGFAESAGGSEEVIRQHRELFIPVTREAAVATKGMPIVDVGCGRGEFLGLMRIAGVEAFGVDTSECLGERLREEGHRVQTEDAVTFLESTPDRSLGGVVCFNVVEHMDSFYFLRFLRLTARKVAPGGCVILGTSNPECPFEMGVFWLDLTHVRPYHHATCACYLSQLGFGSVRTVFYDPAPIPLRTSNDGSSPYRAYAVVGVRSLPKGTVGAGAM